MDISIIIPNYNGESLLKANLEKVYRECAAYKFGKTEIIVVDDCSTDKSVEAINELKSAKVNRIILIKNAKNLGFAPTVNKGVKAAKGEIVILLNTDVYPEENFLEPLLEHFADEKVFAVGCLDRSVEDSGTILRGRGLGVWKRGFLVHRRGEVDKTNTLWVSGGSGAFRKSIWESLGGLNELYAPFYWEDIDLSYRALKSGYKVLFEPKSVVVHEHEKGAIKTKYSETKIKIIAYKNQFIFVWENADLSLIFSHILWLPYYFIKAVLNSDWPFVLGFLNAFLLMPKVAIRRYKAQKLFVKKDAEVTQEFV
jgi:GT2 family glycosyltransferase